MSDPPNWLLRQEGPRLRISDDVSIRAVLTLVLRLGRRAQLEVYEQLGAYLAEAGEPESRHAATVRRQADALHALQLVADAADLPPGRAPTRTEFKEHAPKLGIEQSVTTIGRIFRSWGNAKTAFERGVLPETARQVRVRETRRSHNGRGPADHIALFLEWAKGTDDHSSRNYEQWRKTYAVEAAATGGQIPAAGKSLIRVAPGLSFEDLVELYKASGLDGIDLTEVAYERARAAIAPDVNPLRLVTGPQAAALMRQPQTYVETRVGKPGFLTPVGTVAKVRVFLAEDALTYAATGNAPQRDPDHITGHLLDRDAFAEHLRLNSEEMKKAVMRKGETPRATNAIRDLPPPDGHAGRHEYWLPETIQAWETSRYASPERTERPR